MTGNSMNIGEVLEFLPHRYPFLLVDGVVDIALGDCIHAYKNVSINEQYFLGHFPGNPVMPGVLIIEALAQACGILAFKTLGRKPSDGVIYYLAAIEKVRFRRPVMPGDRLDLHARSTASRRSLVKFDCQAFVSGALAASCALSCVEQQVSVAG